MSTIDKEDKTLLTISNAIVRIRGKEDMLDFISGYLKQHISFDDGFILRYNINTRSGTPYIYLTEKQGNQGPTFNSYSDLVYPVPGDNIHESNYPIVYNRSSMLPPGIGQLAVLSKTGIEEFVEVRLAAGNQLTGFLILLSQKLNSFGPEDLDLLHKLSYQLSLVTVNIIANEEIAKREEEKSILLSLSNEIVIVKGKKELSELLERKLTGLFSISGFGITLLNDDQETHSPFIVDAHNDLKQDSDYRKVVSLKYSVRDGVFNRIIDEDGPVTLRVDELASLEEAPEYVEFWNKMGIEKVVGIPIRVGENRLGCFILLHNHHIDHELNINLLIGTCAQLSVAISNILGLEELAKREKEKTTLLSLSYEIAALRSREDLFRVFKASFKNLFYINEFGIGQIDEDSDTYSAFILDIGSEVRNQPDYHDVTSARYHVDDFLFTRVMNSDGPVLFQVEELAEMPGVPAYVHFWKSAGIPEVLCVALRSRGTNIGCAFLHTEPGSTPTLNTNLLSGVCAYLSVAISNILANQKINNQLVEINRYKQQLEQEKIYLRQEIETTQNYADIIGGSSAMKKVFRLVEQVAPSASTVLLMGETGTGKELVARAIHNSSSRKGKLMIKLNCAALPANLIESELFGHERGSFTGATERRLGKFELANNGSLFLDEIGEMPMELQVKLLRAIQEREIERVGGSQTIKVDVRIIAATNRELEKMVDEGKFRTDLYYRLNVFPIHLPPLRERREDIPALADYFLNRFSKKTGKHIHAFSNRVIRDFMEYSWPGNIREMEHLVERSVLLAKSSTIDEIHLPTKMKSLPSADVEQGGIKTIDENEKEHILKVIKYCKGKISGQTGAASLLGIPTSTLNSKMKKLGIKKDFFS